MAKKSVKKALKEDLFPYEYIVDFNGQKAAERCGYSPATARSQASRLLTKSNVQAKVKALLVARKAETVMTAQEWDERVTALCRANQKDYHDENGVPKKVSELTRDEAYALKGVTTFTKESASGESMVMGQVVELHNPEKSLKLMGQRLGLLKVKIDASESFEALMREIHGLPPVGTKEPGE